jgi:hypothetical protein
MVTAELRGCDFGEVTIRSGAAAWPAGSVLQDCRHACFGHNTLGDGLGGTDFDFRWRIDFEPPPIAALSAFPYAQLNWTTPRAAMASTVRPFRVAGNGRPGALDLTAISAKRTAAGPPLTRNATVTLVLLADPKTR